MCQAGGAWISAIGAGFGSFAEVRGVDRFSGRLGCAGEESVHAEGAEFGAEVAEFVVARLAPVDPTLWQVRQRMGHPGLWLGQSGLQRDFDF